MTIATNVSKFTRTLRVPLAAGLAASDYDGADRVSEPAPGARDGFSLVASWWMSTADGSAGSSTIFGMDDFDLEIAWTDLAQGLREIQVQTVGPGGPVAGFQSQLLVAPDLEWHHVVLALDGSSTGNSRMYIDGVGAPLTLLADNPEAGPIDFSQPIHIGATFAFFSAISFYTGALSELYLNLNSYLDLDDPEVRARFRNPDTGEPVDLGVAGELANPGGKLPEVYSPSGDPVAGNLGTSGAFSTVDGDGPAATAGTVPGSATASVVVVLPELEDAAVKVVPGPGGGDTMNVAFSNSDQLAEVSQDVGLSVDFAGKVVTRNDGQTWLSQGYGPGQIVDITGGVNKQPDPTKNVGQLPYAKGQNDRTGLKVISVSGADMTVAGPGFATETGFTYTVTARAFPGPSAGFVDWATGSTAVAASEPLPPGTTAVRAVSAGAVAGEVQVTGNRPTP